MQNNKNFLGTEPVGKLLLKLSIPTVIAQLINMLYNIVDRIYIGHIPGEGSLALTGVGVCMPIIMIVSAFAALVSSGGAPRASIYMGKQNNKSAENILGNCFILQIIISVILTAILLIWGRDLLLAFGASENTISYATDYMHIYAFGTLFVQLTLGMNAFITAQGFTTFSMVSVLIGAVCNIVLDPVFIFVFHMGVRGAALATVISQAISTLWVVLFLCGKKTQLHLRKKHLHLEAKVVLPCIALGLAAFIMQSSESIVTVCFNSSLLRYGGDIAVGAMTILTSVMQFAMLPLQGIAQGAQPISSYNYGAKNGCMGLVVLCRKIASGKVCQKCRQSKENFSFASDHLSVIFCTPLGCCTACSQSICKHFYGRYKSYRIYCTNAENLSGWSVPLRYPDCLSDDLYLPWKGSKLYYCCCCP